MKIDNLFNSFKSENTFEGVYVGETGYRSNALKSKAIDMKVKGCLLIEISEALNVSYDRIAKWCSDTEIVTFNILNCKNIECNKEFTGSKRSKYCCDKCRVKQWRVNNGHYNFKDNVHSTDNFRGYVYYY